MSAAEAEKRRLAGDERGVEGGRRLLTRLPRSALLPPAKLRIVDADVPYGSGGSGLRSLLGPALAGKARPLRVRWTGKWEWEEEREAAVVIKDALEALRPIAAVLEFPVETLTTPRYLERRFRTGPQAERAGFLAASGDFMRSAVVENSDGGIDILAASEEGERVYTAVSVLPSGARGARVVAACTCSDRRRLGVCPHIAALAYRHLPEIAATAARLRGRRADAGRLARELRERVERLKSEGFTQVDDALSYYSAKLLHDSGLLAVAEGGGVAEALAKAVEEALAGVEGEYLKREAEPQEMEAPGEASAPEEWMEAEAERLRGRLRGLASELSQRMGRRLSPWAEILVFAAVASADHLSPPAAIHVVGRMGTFKTTAPRLLARSIRVPLLELRARGDPRRLYEELLEALSKSLGVPRAQLDRRVGGLVQGVLASGDGLSVRLSLPALASLAASRAESGEQAMEALAGLLQRLREAGFAASIIHAPARAEVVEHLQLHRLEAYKHSYQPDQHLGVITRSEILDSHVLVVDEGSRNPEGLEGLLTRMSVSSITESLRVIVVTDNPEPHVEMQGSPRYAPLYDRMYTVFAGEAYDEASSLEALQAPPRAAVSALELLAARRLVERVAVPRPLVGGLRALFEALRAKHRLLQLDDTAVLLPIPRGERAPMEVDPLQPGFEFRFHGSPGRFLAHTLELARYRAFVSGRWAVRFEDASWALMFTVPSRVSLPDSPPDLYLLRVGAVASLAVNALPRLWRAHAEAERSVLNPLREGRVEEASRAVESLASRASLQPELAPALTVALASYAAEAVSLELDSLPRPLALNLAATLLYRGEYQLLAGSQTASELLEALGEDEG